MPNVRLLEGGVNNAVSRSVGASIREERLRASELDGRTKFLMTVKADDPTTRHGVSSPVEYGTTKTLGHGLDRLARG